jgi:hypothetical protein
MNPLSSIPGVSVAQVAFGERLGLDLRGSTVSVAAARIEDAVDLGFWGRELGNPTPKQVELAAKFGYDISAFSRRVGDAIISDLMEQLNHDAIKAEGLATGVTVINLHDDVPTKYTISSVYPDGTVYFRGGNGKRAWARSLRRAAAESDNSANALDTTAPE